MTYTAAFKHWSYKVPAIKRPHRKPEDEAERFGTITEWAWAPICNGIVELSKGQNRFKSEHECVVAAHTALGIDTLRSVES